MALRLALGDLGPQRAEHPRGDLGRVGDDQDRVALAAHVVRSFAARSPPRTRNFAIGERQPPSSSTTAQASPFAPSDCAFSVSASKRLRGNSPPALSARTTPPDSIAPAKTLNSLAAEHVGQVHDLDAQPAVGPVGAVAQHRLVVGHALERQRDLDAAEREHALEQAVDHVEHVLLLDERHLHVELGELGLAVGAEVLVAEAARDLEVALEAADHQQLLEELRRLRQRVPGAAHEPARHEEVARALGRRAGHDRRLDLEEALVWRGSRGSP